MLAALALAACADDGARFAAKRVAEHVVNGEVSPSGGREDAALLLHTVVDGGDLICSSSLVAPNLVITARHCVSNLVRGLFTCTAQGELVSTDAGAGSLGTHLPADTLEFYGGMTPRSKPLAYGKEVLSTLSETVCVNDLAFVVLDRALDLPVLPLRLGGRALRDEPVTLVGYGLDDAMSQTETLDLKTQPRTHNDTLVVADVGPDEADPSVLLTAPPRTVVVEGPAGCLGDSGGPLMARETGAVLGVYSLLAGSGCLAVDARHLFAHVPVFEALTDDAFTAAGAEPTPEASETSGGAGAGNAPGEGGSGNGNGGGNAGGDATGAAGASNSAAGAGAGVAAAGGSGTGAGAGAAGVGEAGAGAGAAGVGVGEAGTGAGAPEGMKANPVRRRRSGCGVAAPEGGGSGSGIGALLAVVAAALRRSAKERGARRL